MIRTDLTAALDPVAFAASLGFTPDPWQAHALRWNGKRLLLNCCRQSGKSSTAGILALHRALFYPGSLILLVSPSLRQSSELFRKVQDALSKLEQQPSLQEDNKLSLTLENRSRIVSLPSTEATIRGFSGAALIIEDEAARVGDELYFAVRPMLAVSGGKLILMSTPFGKRGHFFREWTEGQAWERIKITAHDCPRISAEFLQEEKAAMPDFFYQSEYLGSFTETVDQVFTYEQVQNAISDDIEPLLIGD
ncbi:Terminase-like family [Candidatus Methanoperedens nitroreducens]|uniref:Terminase-like family n=1 Tax=Candidatus Methanoperedens nitratireducens TaxID=1392998 RepID=A0A062V866_9EURY|nr:terminase family protein [Candidatus Methanoperedens nitroreducens]KCZ73477.1 Terminase-like family [Candidatus Methanoperedens nitroreducens]MDJ1422567.1 terminase family protein [Candidatus Methanoperedens sp.]